MVRKTPPPEIPGRGCANVTAMELGPAVPKGPCGSHGGAQRGALPLSATRAADGALQQQQTRQIGRAHARPAKAGVAAKPAGVRVMQDHRIFRVGLYEVLLIPRFVRCDADVWVRPGVRHIPQTKGVPQAPQGLGRVFVTRFPKKPRVFLIWKRAFIRPGAPKEKGQHTKDAAPSLRLLLPMLPSGQPCRGNPSCPGSCGGSTLRVCRRRANASPG